VQRDNRTQVPLTNPGVMPASINLKAHTQYTGWQIYRYISKFNLVAEWTTYRPHPHPKRDGLDEKHKDGPKKDLCQTIAPDPNRPVHLYVNGIYLLFGGMQLARDGTGLLPPNEEPYLH
jgi:hypothetical protein